MIRPCSQQSLTTERLTLRWFTEDDAALMLAVWNDPDFVAVLDEAKAIGLERVTATTSCGLLGLVRVAFTTRSSPAPPAPSTSDHPTRAALVSISPVAG